jgi:hypothetical protein
LKRNFQNEEELMQEDLSVLTRANRVPDHAN